MAAGLASALALPFVLVKVLMEGYPPPLVVLSFALPAASLFAFAVLVGRFLRVVPPPEIEPTMWTRAVLAACISGPLLFAFHNTLLAHPSALTLNALLLGGALAGGTLSATTQLIARRFHPRSKHY